MSDLRQPVSEQEPELPASVLRTPYSDRVPKSDANASLPGDVHLTRQLDKAQYLLAYAAEAGVAIKDELRNDVLRCRAAVTRGWSDEAAATLLSALTEISAILRPVTVESLKLTASPEEADKKSAFYKHAMYLLFAALIPFSICTFCTAKLSSAIDRDVEVAHQLAVKLNNELYVPGDQGPVSPREVAKQFAPGTTQASYIEDLTQFAESIRALNWDAVKLNAFVLFTVRRSYEHEELELDQSLRDLPALTNQRTAAFQKVRYFAQNVQKDTAIWYGAIASCVLPMLYALLGALAYLLRTFEQQVKTRTLPNTDGHAARLAIAAIGGFVVGLFNVSVAGTPNISPLAIAFLVGYAVDVFFSFLQSVIQTFARPPQAEAPASNARRK